MHAREKALIAQLELVPHPEGGFYREIFRSAATVSPADGRGVRAALTNIHFLLPAGTVSRWHRVSSDEIWHLYEGGPLELLELDPQCRTLTTRHLAVDSVARSHAVVADHWQAARALGDYALVGCTVAPGFDFADFHMLADDSDRARLVRNQWPEAASFL